MNPRVIHAGDVVVAVRELCIRASYEVPRETIEALERALEREESPLGKAVLEAILANHRMAREDRVPACQDTGLAVVFLDVGQDVHIRGGDLTEAINEGVRRGYEEGYLRKSVVSDPLFERKNTRDNTPAIVHTRIVPGDRLHITVAPKGGGAENMSAIAMLTPAAGVEGVKTFIVDHVRRAGANPCPPIVVGVGIGGDFEASALLAKRAAVRPIGQANGDPRYARLESELLEQVNNLGIGPQGFGGRVTALAVHVEALPCHLASLPVAVNINCHVGPHLSKEL